MKKYTVASLFLWLITGGTAAILGLQLMPSTIETSSIASRMEAATYNLVDIQNLFTTQATEKKSDPIPKSKIHLLGVLNSEKNIESSALIAIEGYALKHYHINSTLPNGWQINSIDSKKVIIQNKEKEEIILKLPVKN